ncbi:hypothetical protein [Persicobacter psychrovividus]|uniref:Uncharacterized protein n=1 Tax=Persicobacter psychrovividus TaxID=387638 RepID=A0ABN6LEE0_9BACT|nr:hypothetical protein PEPS_37840 [Persicobacter psychrovividus]
MKYVVGLLLVACLFFPLQGRGQNSEDGFKPVSESTKIGDWSMNTLVYHAFPKFNADGNYRLWLQQNYKLRNSPLNLRMEESFGLKNALVGYIDYYLPLTSHFLFAGSIGSGYNFTTATKVSEETGEVLQRGAMVSQLGWACVFIAPLNINRLTVVLASEPEYQWVREVWDWTNYIAIVSWKVSDHTAVQARIIGDYTHGYLYQAGAGVSIDLAR